MNHRHLAAGALLAFVSAASQAAPVDLSSRLHSMDVNRTDRGDNDDLSFATVSGFAPPAHRVGTGMDPFRPGQRGSHEWHHGHAQPVPEPGTVALWLAGLGVVGFLGVRRKLDR